LAAFSAIGGALGVATMGWMLGYPLLRTLFPPKFVLRDGTVSPGQLCLSAVAGGAAALFAVGAGRVMYGWCQRSRVLAALLAAVGLGLIAELVWHLIPREPPYLISYF
jgi:hypothetical protein